MTANAHRRTAVRSPLCPTSGAPVLPPYGTPARVLRPDLLLLVGAMLSRIRALEDENAALMRQRRPPLALLIWATMRGPFLAADAVAEAERQAEAARAVGQAVPELPRLFAEAGIDNVKKLGQWLRRNGFGIVSREGGKAIWVLISTQADLY